MTAKDPSGTAARLAAGGAAALLLFPAKPARAEPLPPPNFLFIAIDDLKTACGHMSEDRGQFLQQIYPDPERRAQVRAVLSPNIDRLAAEGVSFRRAYCASPACNPSRAALMTGVRPHVSGLDDNSGGAFFRNVSPQLAGAVTLPQNLGAHGYFTAGCGKIYHGANHDAADSAISWTTWVSRPIGTADGAISPWCPASATPDHSMKWGRVNAALTTTHDYKNADFIAQIIENGSAAIWDREYGTNVTVSLPADQPFFLACGLFRPHLPFYAPGELLDLFPASEMTITRQMRDALSADVLDLPPTALNLIYAKILAGDVVTSNDRMAQVFEHGVSVDPADGDLKAWKDMISHYLASVALADRCVGRLLDAVENSPRRDNTVAILWSDHGYHLGEKLHVSKFALWDEAARVVFLIKDPRRPQSAGIPCHRPVGLGDVYRTVCALAGAPLPPDQVAGRDLTPLLDDPRAAWNVPALTTYQATNHNAVRMETLTYIRYNGNANEVELYETDLDPDEITNLVADVRYDGARSNMNALLDLALVEAPFPEERRMRLANWRYGYWASARDEGPGADLADADGDGILNLMECALGLDPLAPATNGRPALCVVSAGSGDGVGLRFTSLDLSNDVVLAVSAAETLTEPVSDWEDLWDSSVSGAVESVTVTNYGNGIRLLQVPAGMSGSDRQYFRLRAFTP